MGKKKKNKAKKETKKKCCAKYKKKGECCSKCPISVKVQKKIKQAA